MEAGLGDALVCARRRLRDGRKGSDRSRSSCPLVSRGFWGLAPPLGFDCKLFLDENGQKISKTKGNGLTIEQWLAYASPESLCFVHVPEAHSSEATIFRRHSAHGRRLSRISRNLPPPAMEGATGQSSMAHSRRSATRTQSPDPRAAQYGTDFLHHAAQSRRGFQQRKSVSSVGVPSPPLSLGVAKNAPPSQQPGSLCGRLFSRLCRPQETLPRRRRHQRGVLTQISYKLSQLPAKASADQIQHALYDIARPIRDIRTTQPREQRPNGPESQTSSST